MCNENQICSRPANPFNRVTSPLGIVARRAGAFKDATMRNIINLAGKTFGRLRVLGLAEKSKGGETLWECVCECGETKKVQSGNLKTGHTKSCGCLANELTSKRSFIHGLTNSLEHGIWNTMIQRCTNPNTAAYPRYGARGIKVCRRWRFSFKDFLQDMGNRPTNRHSIERKDNNGDYEPENCLWATSKEQGLNKCNNLMVTVRGLKKPLSFWCPDAVIYQRAWGRIKKGWNHERAVYEPTRSNG